jgi:hypothetical protein
MAGEDEAGAGAVAPADYRGFGDDETVHHGEDVAAELIVGVRLGVAGAAPVAATVDDDDAVTGGDEGRELVAKIAGIAHAAMQQDHRAAGAIGGVPDAGAVGFEMALLIGGGKRRRTFGLEAAEVEIGGFGGHQCTPAG